MFNLHVFILLLIPSPLLSFMFFLSFPFFFLFSALSLQIQLYMYVSKYPLSHVLLCVIVFFIVKSSSCLFILNFFISSLYLTLKKHASFSFSFVFLPICFVSSTPVSFPLFLPFFSLFFSTSFSHLHLCTIIYPYFLGYSFSAYCVWISCLFLKVLQMSKAIVYMW